MRQILFFKEVDRKDIGLVGGKGANLGELTQAGIPVPQGFIVTTEAYFDFVRKNKIDRKIKSQLAGIDPEQTKKLNDCSKAIKALIIKSPMSPKLTKEIKQWYHTLGLEVLVAIRSSATAEDLPEASFAGQQATFLNIKGADEVVDAIRRCWASLFEPRSIYYRTINKFDHLKVGIAVPVQRMVQSEKSGILFTIDPVTNDQSKMVIEAIFGLGEAIVSGSVTPDRYLVNKEDLKILNKEINQQAWQIIKAGKTNKHVTLSKAESEKQKISDQEILELAKLGKKIEEHYHFPQDTEWAIEGKTIYFVQSRPVSTIKEGGLPKSTAEIQGQEGKELTDLEVLLKGAAASVGVASGPVKIIHKPTEIDQVKEGNILVTEMTTPDFVPAMRRAKAIVTDTGGRTCHAAIVSREMGIPCVVGTGKATALLKDNMIITVDGAEGMIYKGKVKDQIPNTPAQPIASGIKAMQEEVPITATKVYVNLGEPELAEEVSKLPCDGVGLMRAEFMIAELGEHPKALVEKGQSKKYVDQLVKGIRTIAQAFHPRPVIYRATDFKTNEYHNLKGGEKFEPQENNPMIGYRGCFRYLKEPDLFGLEVEAIRQVRDQFELKNVWMMIPFVRTVNELVQVRKIIESHGLSQSNDFRLWIMVEVPSTILLARRFCETGIDGVSIGSNDLTQLILGIDRDSQVLAEEFDERDEAVSLAIKHLIRICREHHVTVSICGQAPSVYPEVTEMLVKEGVTSVSVSPDMVLATRKLIASVEKKIMLESIVEENDHE